MIVSGVQNKIFFSSKQLFAYTVGMGGGWIIIGRNINMLHFTQMARCLLTYLSGFEKRILHSDDGRNVSIIHVQYMYTPEYSRISEWIEWRTTKH